MSYNDREADQQQQQSAELYTLTSGDEIVRLTSYYTDITLDGNTYTHVPLKRSAFTRDITGSIPSLTIDAPIIAPFTGYIAETPINPTRVQIHKYFLYGAAWSHVLMFIGIIKSVMVQENAVRANCLSKEYELKKQIPHVLIQGYCNNTLYDDVCAANRNLYKVEATITGIGTTKPYTLTANEFTDLLIFTNMKHGTVHFGDQVRYIVNHDGDTKTITIAGGQFRDIAIGSPVIVYGGCDKSPYMCKEKWNNLPQFVGFPYVPDRSPLL